MSTPSSLPPLTAANPSHNSLARLGWRRLRRDRLGFAALCIVGVYLLLALGAWSGLLARHWQDEVAKPFAPPTLFVGVGPQHVELNAADIDAASQRSRAAAAGDSSAATGLAASEDPLAADMAAAQQQAAQYRSAEAPKADSLPLGADQRGRDVLQKVLQGTATSLLVGLSGALLALAIGTVLGAISGYFGGLLDDLLLWGYSVFTSVPDMLLLLAFAAVSGRGIGTVVLVMAFTSWTGSYRLMRAEFLKHKSREYVRAADAIGASHSRRMFHHILPNVSHLLLVQFSMLTVALIKYEAILSFLGFGVGVTQVSLGAMLAEAPAELLQGYWWQMLTVTVVMSLLVTAFALLTDSLRDALDPKVK
ncbi:ABC transporter permease [Vogesella sp. GCM10023246]|uniref:ABC transporter permease n=1 Tax=Vogesella oryzagri TaxID=3160864 RepID=A0ABV1M715_9NEIS